MSKKKKKSTETKPAEKKTNVLLGIAGAVFVVMIAYVGLQGMSSEKAPITAQNAASNASIPSKVVKAGLIETRPVLPASRYRGRVAQIYEYASKIPEVLDKLYCYCLCKENPRFRHKNLLTCFTDDHASNCGVCLDEAAAAWEMTQDGKTPDEIRAAIDSTYRRR